MPHTDIINTPIISDCDLENVTLSSIESHTTDEEWRQCQPGRAKFSGLFDRFEHNTSGKRLLQEMAKPYYFPALWHPSGNSMLSVPSLGPARPTCSSAISCGCVLCACTLWRLSVLTRTAGAWPEHAPSAPESRRAELGSLDWSLNTTFTAELPVTKHFISAHLTANSEKTHAHW